MSRSEFVAHATYVFPATKSLVVAIPKAGCTTIKHMVAASVHIVNGPMGREADKDMWVHERSTLKEIPTISVDVEYPGYTLFAYIRNPYARVVSAWADKILLQDIGYTSLDTRVPQDMKDVLEDFEAFVLSPRFGNLAVSDAHFIPQQQLVNWSTPDTLPCSNVVQIVLESSPPFQRLASLLNVPVPPQRFNQGPPFDYRSFIQNPAVRLKIESVYAEDFARLHGRESGHLSPQLSLDPSFLPWAIRTIRARNYLIETLHNNDTL